VAQGLTVVDGMVKRGGEAQGIVRHWRWGRQLGDEESDEGGGGSCLVEVVIRLEVMHGD